MYVRVREALTHSGLPDLDYALNPYMGCIHGCLYCYAREYTRIREIAENWGQVVAIKINIVEVLSREVKRKKRGIVGIGTITDAYQAIEKDYNLTRRCIEILLDHGYRVSIQTKSDLVLRDLDVFLKHRDRVDIGLTITTLDDEIAKIIEPRAPKPSARVYALKELSAYGLETWIFLGPIIPGINDDPENIESIVRLAKETNSILYYDKLRIKDFMYRNDEYRFLIKSVKGYRWEELFSYIEKLCRNYRVTCKPGFEYKPIEDRDAIITLDRYLSR